MTSPTSNIHFRTFIEQVECLTDVYEDEQEECVNLITTFDDAHQQLIKLTSIRRFFQDAVSEDLRQLSANPTKAAKKQASMLEMILRDFAELGSRYRPLPHYLRLFDQASEKQRTTWRTAITDIMQASLLEHGHRQYQRVQEVWDAYVTHDRRTQGGHEIEGDVFSLSEKLVSQVVQQAHQWVLENFTKLTNPKWAIPYVFDIDERQRLMAQQMGRPDQALTFQESWEYHWQTTVPLQATKALGIVTTSNGTLAVPAPIPPKKERTKPVAMLKRLTLLQVQELFSNARLSGVSKPGEWAAALLALSDQGVLVGTPHAILRWIEQNEIPASIKYGTLKNNKDYTPIDYTGSPKQIYNNISSRVKEILSRSKRA